MSKEEDDDERPELETDQDENKDQNQDQNQNQDEDDDESVEELCSICLRWIDPTRHVSASMPNCGHTFHIACIGRGLEHQHRCPLCRRDVDIDIQPNLTMWSVNRHLPRTDLREDRRDEEAQSPIEQLPFHSVLTPANREGSPVLRIWTADNPRPRPFLIPPQSPPPVWTHRRVRPAQRIFIPQVESREIRVDFTWMSNGSIVDMSRAQEVRYIDTHGNTVLHIACLRGISQAVDMVLARTTTPEELVGQTNLAGQTPVHSCLSCRVRDPRPCLLRLAPHIRSHTLTTQDFNGRTPLLLSFARGHIMCANILLRKHETFHTSTGTSDHNGCNCFHYAVQMDDMTTTMLQRLYITGCHIRQTEKSTGDTAWHWTSNEDLIEWALSRDTGVRAIRSFDGQTVF